MKKTVLVLTALLAGPGGVAYSQAYNPYQPSPYYPQPNPTVQMRTLDSIEFYYAQERASMAMNEAKDNLAAAGALVAQAQIYQNGYYFSYRITYTVREDYYNSLQIATYDGSCQYYSHEAAEKAAHDAMASMKTAGIFPLQCAVVPSGYCFTIRVSYAFKGAGGWAPQPRLQTYDGMRYYASFEEARAKMEAAKRALSSMGAAVVEAFPAQSGAYVTYKISFIPRVDACREFRIDYYNSITTFYSYEAARQSLDETVRNMSANSAIIEADVLPAGYYFTFRVAYVLK